MTFSTEQTKSLADSLLRDHVKRNPRGYSYIQGWWAIAEANRIFGFGEWDRLTEELRQLGEPYADAKGQMRVSYFARVRIIVRAQDEIVTRDGCGYGSGIDKDIGQAHESAIKEAETDAMKRALMTFGNPFGLALYDAAQTNVAAAPEPEKPISAYRAKKEGMGERAAAVAHEMTDIMAVTELLAWRESKEAEVATWPLPWQTALWENYDIHLADLRTIIARESGADEETGEMAEA